MAALNVFQQGLNRSKAPGAESALGAISDDMVLGMQGQFFHSLEG